MNVISGIFEKLPLPSWGFNVQLWLIVWGIVALLWLFDQLLAPITPLKYGMVGFFGKRGSGKSFAMTAYARRWRHFNPNKPVWTNLEKFKLPGKGNIFLNCNFDDIMKARDGLICIDEAGLFINAWNFATRNNREMATWLAATRHNECMVLMTAHVPDTINVRVRKLIEEFYFMSPMTKIWMFKADVFESDVTLGDKSKKTKTVWIPMLPTVCRSYNTNSLRVKADALNTNVIGEHVEDIANVGVSPTVSESPTEIPFVKSENDTCALDRIGQNLIPVFTERYQKEKETKIEENNNGKKEAYVEKSWSDLVKDIA